MKKIDNENPYNEEVTRNIIELIEILREIDSRQSDNQDTSNELYLLDKDGNKIIL